MHAVSRGYSTTHTGFSNFHYQAPIGLLGFRAWGLNMRIAHCKHGRKRSGRHSDYSTTHTGFSNFHYQAPIGLMLDPV